MVPPRTILVVEHDQRTRDLYRHTLLGAGFNVIGVSDGVDALNAIDHGNLPDAIVLDLELPRLAGLDVYAELRAHPATQRIPVVVVTGIELPPEQQSDFHFVLRKPVAAAALIFAVDNALRRAPGI